MHSQLRLRFKIFLGFLFIAILAIALQIASLVYLFNISIEPLQLLIVISTTFILLTLVGFLFSAWFTQSIKKLKTELKNIDEGKNLTYEITVNSSDDIEEIAGSFNALYKKLNNLENQLKQEDRTLADMNSKLVHKDTDTNKILTDFTQKEAVLAAEKNKLEIILSGINDAVIGLDMNHVIVTFNMSAEKLTGYTSAQTIGKPLYNIIKFIENNQELAAEEYCPIKSASTDEGVVCTKQDIKLVGLNKESYVNITSGKIKQGAQLNLGCILSIHDITEQRQLEEMRLNFVSMAAHELRTPLTSLKGYLNILIEETLQTLPDDQKTILKRMQIALRQLMSLIENLLSVTRMDRGAFVINQKTIDWLPIVQETVEELLNTANEKQITLEFAKPLTPLQHISVDQVRVTEVLTNLIANAINYTQPGGKITVTVEQTSTEMITHVHDTGEGIPKEAMKSLFHKFFRVAGKLEHGSRGTGLGLFISKTIIDMHHGRIWVDSVLGQGSTFSFALPLVLPANVPATIPASVATNVPISKPI